MNETIVSMDSISKSFPGVKALDHVHFELRSGEVMALLGENGAGKSTLLKLLLGELYPGEKKGGISIFGCDIRQFKNWKCLSYVPQSGMASCQNFPASVEEIVQANLYAQIGLFRFAGKREKDQVRQALFQVGMEDYAKRLIGRLSGGQQQKILLARALVSQPRLLILDEPATGMDERSTEDFYRLVKRINLEQGVTVLMVTHDRKRLEAFADDIWLLEDGGMELIRAGEGECAHGDL